MGVHLNFWGGNWRLLGNSCGLFEASWQFIFGSFRVHWRLLENCLGFILSSMGQWESIGIALGIIEGYWRIVDVHLEFVGSSFLVHFEFIWGSLEAIGYLSGVQLWLICSFGGSLEFHL